MFGVVVARNGNLYNLHQEASEYSIIKRLIKNLSHEYGWVLNIDRLQQPSTFLFSDFSFHYSIQSSIVSVWVCVRIPQCVLCLCLWTNDCWVCSYILNAKCIRRMRPYYKPQQQQLSPSIFPPTSFLFSVITFYSGKWYGNNDKERRIFFGAVQPSIGGFRYMPFLCMYVCIYHIWSDVKCWGWSKSVCVFFWKYINRYSKWFLKIHKNTYIRQASKASRLFRVHLTLS